MNTTQPTTHVRHLRSHTYNPYLPAIGRLLEELRRLAHALNSTTLQASHRNLAEAIGTSASRIPDLMRQLEADGHIARSPYKNSYLIELLDSPLPERSGMFDRSAVASAGEEPKNDHPTRASFFGTDTPETDSLPLAPPDRSPAHNKEGVMSHESESESGARIHPRWPDYDQALYQVVTQESSEANGHLAMKIARSGLGSASDFEADLAEARRNPRTRNAFALVVSYWRDGQRLPPQYVRALMPPRKESLHVPQSRQQSAPQLVESRPALTDSSGSPFNLGSWRPARPW